MKDRTADIDAWHTTTLHLIDQLRDHLTALTRTSPEPSLPRPRKPSPREKEATRRADGRYEPTVTNRGRSPHTQVEAALLAHEYAVQSATTDLSSLVTATLDIRPTDGNGTLRIPPSEPPLRTTATGRTVIDVDPARCRNHILASAHWLAACTDHLADQAYTRNRQDDGPFGTGQLALLSVLERARQLTRDVTTISRKHDVPVGRLCRCGCGQPAPPKGEGATREVCRQRQSRQRQSA